MQQTRYCATFNEIAKHDAARAGGKGASLGEMTQAGIPVPPGFVVLAETFDHFIAETDLAQEIAAALGAVQHDNIATVEHASAQIQGMIRSAQMPADIGAEILAQHEVLGAEYVAVRSSATAEDGASHAWAGQLDTYLNTPREHVLEKVQHCWASLFTPRAIFYRFEKGLHTTHISVAVVVQKMVQAEVSGIAFSVHPVTEDRNQLIIEAGYGLGEAIVSGQVTPDSYVVTKTPRAIIDTNIATQTRGLYRSATGSLEHGHNEWSDIAEPRASAQVLTNEHILELAALILKIESHYGFPCDIEWAMETGVFYITQSRPITTLSLPDTGTNSGVGDVLERAGIYTQQEKVVTNDATGRVVLQKDYTRDTTIIIQEAWGRALAASHEAHWVWKNPHVPAVVHSFAHGTIEIWQNPAAVTWITNIIRERALCEPSWLVSTLDALDVRVRSIKMRWQHAALESVEALEIFINDVFAMMPEYIVYYYASLDDRTAHDVLARLHAYRETDVIFASVSRCIRDTLIHLYPDRSGYETTICAAEIRTPPDVSVLKRRHNAFTVVDGVTAHSWSFAEYIAQNPGVTVVTEVQDLGDGIRGTTGYAGRVTGRVYVLYRRDQLAMVPDGAVLVSPMTTPDFLPAMQKAMAFVTDEGGITCHAGIVAREMKKPCIIGTKIATQVLHDGDLVEVDANNGMVRVLEQAAAPGEPFVQAYTSNVWQQMGRWPQKPLPESFWVSWADTNSARTLFPAHTGTPVFDVDGYFYLATQDATYLRTHLAELYRAGTLGAFVDAYEEVQQRLATQYEDYFARGVHTGDVSTLVALHKELACPWFLGSLFSDTLMQVAHDVGLVKTELEFFELVFPHLEPSWIENEERSIGALAQACIDAGVPELSATHAERTPIREALAAYDQVYYWVGLNKWEGEPQSRAHLYARVNEAIQYLRAGTIVAQKNHTTGAPTDPLVRLAARAAYWRPTCVMLAERFAYHARQSIVDAGARVGLPYEACLYLTCDEVCALVDGSLGAEVLAAVHARMAGPVATYRSPIGDVVVSAHTTDIYTRLAALYAHAPRSASGDNVLRGMAARAGVVQGRACVVTTREEFASFATGDILVAPETTPAFVPLMRIASAIITERGGITSHAAIVSRELNVPCVVGIRGLIDTVHTGDLVEVDANSGVVKVVERAEQQPSIDVFTPEKYIYAGYYKSPLVAAWLWMRSYAPGLSESFGVSKNTIRLCAVSGGHFFWAKETAHYFERVIEEVLATGDISTVNRMVATACEQYAQLQEFLPAIPHTGLTVKTYRDALAKAHELLFFWTFGARGSDTIDAVLVREAEAAGIARADIPMYIETARTPLVEQQRALYALREYCVRCGLFAESAPRTTLGDVKKHTALYSAFCDFRETYAWMTIGNWVGNPLTDEQVLEMLATAAPVVEHKPTHARGRFGTCAALASQLGFLRQSGAEYSAQLQAALMPGLTHVASDMGLEYRELVMLAPDELYNGDVWASHLGARARKRMPDVWCVYTKNDGSVGIIDDQETVTNITAQLVPRNDNSGDELRGDPAYPGRVAARARIVMSVDDFQAFAPGEVLVAPMTTPDFVLLMQQASAIVTDKGGLLCHAAIIAREMKKPCIIGTKNATRVLHDGDLVEVDANSGVVRVVERAR